MRISRKRYYDLVAMRDDLASALEELNEASGFVEGPIEKSRIERARMLTATNLARIRKFRLRIIN